MNKTNWTQASVRVDHRFSDANSMFFRYTHARHYTIGNAIFTDPTVGQAREDTQLNRNVMVSDTHTFSPTLINNLRVGLMRQHFIFEAVNAAKGWPRKLGLPEIVPNDQFPQIDFGFGLIGGQAYGERGSLNWDIQNMITKIAGNHTLKAGYNHRILYGGNRQGAALSGNFTFGGLTTNPQVPAGTGSNLAQFLLGEVGGANIDRILGNSWHGLATSAFFQDDWRVSRRLTLNLGLRWDWQQKPYERNNGHINFDPSARVPGYVHFRARLSMPAAMASRVPSSAKTTTTSDRDLALLSMSSEQARPCCAADTASSIHPFSSETSWAIRNSSRPLPQVWVAQGPGLRAFRFQDGFPTKPLESPGASAGPLALLGQSVEHQ